MALWSCILHPLYYVLTLLHIHRTAGDDILNLQASELLPRLNFTIARYFSKFSRLRTLQRHMLQTLVPYPRLTQTCRFDSIRHGATLRFRDFPATRVADYRGCVVEKIGNLRGRNSEHQVFLVYLFTFFYTKYYSILIVLLKSLNQGSGILQWLTEGF